MGSGTFRGGIHPYDGKELSRDRVIQDIRPGKELAYLVSQHIGAPAKPIVKKGDRVLVGQMIAEAGGFVSAPVYASVSGVVKGIEKRLTATGGYCDAIIVENSESGYRRYGWCRIPYSCKTFTERTGKDQIHSGQWCRM